MKTHLSISLTRNDGKPDNFSLRVAVELNRHGFVLEDAYLQARLPFSTCSPETVFLARVLPPPNFRQVLPRLAGILACDIVLTCEPDEPPRAGVWHVTSDGIYPFERND